MEILYITPSLPNDFSRIRTKNILTALKKQGHRITLLSLYYDKEELSNLSDVKKIVDEIHIFKQSKFISLLNCMIGIVKPYPLRTSYVKNRKLKKYI